MTKKSSFLSERVKSIGYAVRGAYLLITSEASIKVQLVIGTIMTFAGFYFQISTTEWLIQTLAIGMVMSVEGINTAIEAIADFIHPEKHEKIGFIKDIAAGAVFISSIAAVIAGLIIYLPKIT